MMNNCISVFVFLLTIALVLGECPRVITRAEWGARAPRSVEYLPKQPVQYAFIHHSAERECSDEASCVPLVKWIQDFHMDTRGWDDTGYSFVIGGDGSVFEGRGWDRVGAHTLGYNSVGVAFCLMGNFMDHLPPQAQMDAAKAMIDCGVALGKISQNYTLRGHRDMGNTLCPGDKLYEKITTWPNF